jgi:prepilin-type N-terminal cleavage/methylation domain-containing protein
MTATLKRTNKKGFTLVELVIVIAILAILAAIAIPTVSNVITTANQNVDKANAQTVELALKSAAAELQGGTWNGANTGDATTYTYSTLTVSAALIHEGISELPTPKSGAHYVYDHGKVYCEKSSSDSTKDHDGTAINASTTKVSDVIAP